MRYFLMLNYDCNQNCLFCASASSANKNVDTMSALKIILNAINSGAHTIVFSGGEPTLRNDLPLLVNFIKENKPSIYVALSTNAIRLNYKNYTKALRNVDRFLISLHGASAKVNDSLTRFPGGFNRTIAGAKNVQKMGYSFSFYYVITSYNYKQIADFVKLIIRVLPKCDCIMFSYPFFWGNVKQFPFILPKFSDFIPFLEKSQSLCNLNNIEWDISACGLMPLCVHNEYTRKKILNNSQIYNENTIKSKDINGDEIYIPTNNEYLKENFLHTKICEKCDYRLLCPGILKLYAQIYGTSELKPI